MALTYDAIAQFSKIGEYFKALKKEKSLVFNQGKFMLIVINYKGKLDKKTTLVTAYKTEPLAIKAFKDLKDNAKKDVKKNQVALGSYTIDKETGTLNFEITKGAAGPKKVNKRAAKLLKSIYKLNLIATLGANYDGEGDLIDDSDEPDDDEDDLIIEDESPDDDETETTDEEETETKTKPETPAKLDPQINTLAVSINKGIKQLTEKTAPDAKALSMQLLADIPKFLQLTTANAALLPKQLQDYIPIATSFLKKIEKAVAPSEPKEKAPINENQKKARQLNDEIATLVQKIQALEKANAAKKK
jgi:hypothetical protein